MRVIVCDRGTASAGDYLDTAAPHVVISIRDPDRNPARIPKRRDLREVFTIAFDDAAPCPGFKIPDDIQLMTEADARAIWKFVDKHLAAIEVIVVHCEAGMSRSPAVAAAITRRLGGDDQSFFKEYCPNEHVYELMLATRP